MFFSGIADEAGAPIEMQIRAHKELGWRHIEVRNVNKTTLAFAPDAEFDSIRAELDKAGLQVSCFASQIANWSRDVNGPFEKDVDELRSAIPRMRKLKTPFIRIMSYANKNNVAEAEWRAESVRRIREMARMAEDGGVALLHENCDGWAGLGPQQTLELLSEINSPALKLVFDTGNPVPHKQDAWKYYLGVKPHVVYVHIKDYKVEGEKSKACFPGEGKARVADIVADLMKSGYDGGLSIEPHIAAVIHEGKQSTPAELYGSYVEYGRRLMSLVSGLSVKR